MRVGNSNNRIPAGLTVVVLLMLLPLMVMAQKHPPSMTEQQRFSLAVEIIRHFEGWHTIRDYPYVGWGHRLLPGERYDARTMTREQGDRLLRQDLMKMYRMFDGYGKLSGKNVDELRLGASERTSSADDEKNEELPLTFTSCARRTTFSLGPN